MSMMSATAPRRITALRLILALDGIVVLVIGAAILADPPGFHAAYGTVLPDSASLLSELRAPATALLGFGMLMLAGAVRPALSDTAALTATVLYLGYGLGRVLGVSLDGMPDGAILAAAGVELALGLVTLALWRRG
ncbi:DUF4345 domain-containing protein [Halovulum sp. GXIMD14794]